MWSVNLSIDQSIYYTTHVLSPFSLLPVQCWWFPTSVISLHLRVHPLTISWTLPVNTLSILDGGWATVWWDSMAAHPAAHHWCLHRQSHTTQLESVPHIVCYTLITGSNVVHSHA